VRRTVPAAAVVALQTASDEGGKPVIEWSDQSARNALVSGLVHDAEAVLAVAEPAAQSEEAQDAVGLLALIAGQDVEPGEDDGSWRILGDAAHKQSSPLLYQVEETMACWQQISAPVLWVEAAQTDVWRWMGPKEQARVEIDRRIGFLPTVQTAMIDHAGHMLHHDQPEQLARLIEDFLI